MTRKDKFVTNFVTVARRLSVDCFVTGKEGRRQGGFEVAPGPCFILARYLYWGQSTNHRGAED